MRQIVTTLRFATPGRGLIEITDEIASCLRESGFRTGIVTVFCQHTSASLTINENAAPAVKRDLLRWLDGIAPESGAYEHDDEGPDDMPAHIKAMLTGNSLTIPVENGRMMLGTWQGIYLVEHRRRTHPRSVAVHLFGE